MPAKTLVEILKAASPAITSGVDTYVATREAGKERQRKTIFQDEQNFLNTLKLQIQAGQARESTEEKKKSRLQEKSEFQDTLKYRYDALNKRLAALGTTGSNSPDALQLRMEMDVLGALGDFDFTEMNSDEIVKATTLLYQNEILPKWRQKIIDSASGKPVKEETETDTEIDRRVKHRILSKLVEGESKENIELNLKMDFGAEVAQEYIDYLNSIK